MGVNYFLCVRSNFKLILLTLTKLGTPLCSPRSWGNKAKTEPQTKSRTITIPPSFIFFHSITVCTINPLSYHKRNTVEL